MTTGLILLTHSDAAEALAAGRLAPAVAAGRVRRFLPATGPAGEYPDDDSGDLRAVWIVEQPSAAEQSAITGEATAAGGADGAPADGVEAYLVDSLVQWDEPDDDPANGEVTPMRLAFIVSRADLSSEEFVRRWRAHAPVARQHQPDFRRYVQHVVAEALSPAAGAYAAVGEFGFRRLHPGEGIRRFGSPEGQVLVEDDIARFLERSGARSVWIVPA
jgi:hypothetical protein